jgi:hypothetical protein
MFAYKIAGLVEIVLVVMEHSGYFHSAQLPLGGGQIQQIGIVFGAAHVASESMDLLQTIFLRYAAAFRKPRTKMNR